MEQHETGRLVFSTRELVETRIVKAPFTGEDPFDLALPPGVITRRQSAFDHLTQVGRALERAPAFTAAIQTQSTETDEPSLSPSPGHTPDVRLHRRVHMKTSARIVASLAIVLTSAAALLDGQAPKRTLALVGGMLLDGYQVPPVHHAAILIEDDKIVRVGPASEVDHPARCVGDRYQRADDDAGVDRPARASHDPWARRLRAVVPVDRRAWRAAVMEISARQLLMAGVTSAVDLVGPLKESLSVRDRVKAGTIPGPRLSVSGPWITKAPGNYPPELGFQIKATSPADAALAVEQLAKAGVDVIKVYPMTLAEYTAVSVAAHKHGLKVHAHVYDEQNVRDALRAGVDVLTHVGAASRQPYDPALVREIVETGRPVVPTAALWFDVYPATVAFPERLQDPRLRRDFPPDVYAEVQQSFRSWHTLGYFRNMNRVTQFGGPLVRQWISSGAVVGMGTDSGTPMNFHTEALWRELKVFVEQGMSPLRAIEAATRINAQILGKGRELGTIEAGKLADVIVVRGNPLENIAALNDPLIVVKGGVIYKGDHADAQAADARRKP